MKKKIIQKLVVMLIFIIGVLIFTYPFYINGVNYLIDHYRLEQMEKKTAAEKQKKIEEMSKKNKSIQVNGIVIDHDPFDASAVSKTDLKLNEHLIGSVTIPKIDITVPLYDTLSNHILENGAGVLQGTSLPEGGVGNHSVISAHRGLAERLLFRNLDQLVLGDVFMIDLLGETLAYEVTSIKTVKPEETDIIKLSEEEDLVSLLTCTPYMINSHRLIVTGKRTDVTDVLRKEVNNSKKNQRVKQIGILLLCVLLVLLTLIIILKLLKELYLSKNKYNFIFYIRDKKKKPIKNQEFVLFKKGNKLPLKRDGETLILRSDYVGQIQVINLPGGTYSITFLSKPTDMLGKFGVNKLKQKNMSWLGTKNKNIELTKKRSRYIMMLKHSK